MIGCGAVTQVKSAPAYQQQAGFALKGVFNRTFKTAKDYAKRHDIEKVYTSIEQLLNDPEIHAVYIATPPDSHLEYALMVAAANKICCIEKPIAPNYCDAQRIVETFKKAKLPLFVAYYRRSLPRFNKIKTLIESGEIGAIRSVNWQMTRSPSPQDLSNDYNWRTDKLIAPGGYFDDIGCHGLDLFAYLFGDYETVNGIAANQANYYTAYDSIVANWCHSNGITGTGSWHFATDSREDLVTVIGSAGKITFSVLLEAPIRVYKHNQLIDEIIIEHPKHIQAFHVANMAASLIDGSEHPSTGNTALQAAKTMATILKTS